MQYNPEFNAWWEKEGCRIFRDTNLVHGALQETFKEVCYMGWKAGEEFKNENSNTFQ